MLAHGLAQGRVRPSNSTYHLVPVPTMAIYFMAGGKEEGRLSCGVLQAGWGANRTYRILGNSTPHLGPSIARPALCHGELSC